MSILTFSPEFNLTEDIEFNTNIFFPSSKKERRYSKWSEGLRYLTVQLRWQSETDIQTIWDFYIARKGRYDTFWVKFPTHYAIAAEAVGTGNASTTVFNLDYFPVDTSSVIVYLDDVEESNVTPSNDMSNEVAKLTFDSAPGDDVVITADCEFYYQVRFLDDKLTRQSMVYKLLHMGLKFVEVRWATYSPT